MKQIVPDWYPLFRCKAGSCKHTCCAGWEIDIDPDSMDRFLSLPGATGDRLRSVIIPDGEGGGSFRLDEAERCPMLRRDGLCELICQYGPDVLCDICDDHPRFRNHFSDRTELGLGLCCEAVAELVLRREPPMELVIAEDDGDPRDLPDPEELRLLAFRESLMAAAQDRTVPMRDRLSQLLDAAGVTLPGPADWYEPLSALEQMEPAWGIRLLRLKDLRDWPDPADISLPAEQLLCCLLYRHIPGALEDGLLRARIALCVLLLRLMLAVSDGREDLPEAVRLTSAELEYSDENIGILLEHLCHI